MFCEVFKQLIDAERSIAHGEPCDQLTVAPILIFKDSIERLSGDGPTLEDQIQRGFSGNPPELFGGGPGKGDSFRLGRFAPGLRVQICGVGQDAVDVKKEGDVTAVGVRRADRIQSGDYSHVILIDLPARLRSIRVRLSGRRAAVAFA